MSTNTPIHPLACPADRLLFAPTRDRYGVRLALVFGNHAPGGQCPYYAAGRCLFCDIGAGEGAAATPESNRQRLAWFQEHYRQVLPEVAHLVLYNSGSVLNSREMPAEVLDEILAWARSLPVLRLVSLESRESAVTELAVRRVAGTLGPGRMVRVILGLETCDDHLREDILDKRMPRAAINRAVEAIASVAADLGTEQIGLTFNILVGGPGTTLADRRGRCLGDGRFRPGDRPGRQPLGRPQSAPLLPQRPRAIVLPRPPPLFARDGRTGGVGNCGKGCPACSADRQSSSGRRMKATTGTRFHLHLHLVRFVRIEPQDLDRLAKLCLGVLAFAGQLRKRGQGDVLFITARRAERGRTSLQPAEYEFVGDG